MNIHKISIYITFIISLLYNSNLSAQFTNSILLESNTGLITNIITADINNDNFKDILITKKFSANSLISYYLNQGDFNFDTAIPFATGSSQVTNIAVGDFNNDNWIDIASIGDATHSVTLHLNNALSFSEQVLDTFTFFESDISTADVDNDNDLDIIAVGGTTFKVFYNDGAANFTSQTISGPLEDFFDITVADIDADGFQDVITGGSNLSVYKNNNGIFSYDSVRSSQLGQTTGTFSLLIRLVDLDNDGDVDLFREGNNSTGVLWMENDGNGNFTNSHIIDSNVTQIRSATISDFDNDNDLDFIIIQNQNLYLYENDGFGNFGAPSLIQDSQTILSVIHSEDFNNDGLADIIWSADLSVQENNSTLSTQDHLNDNISIQIYPNPSFENLYLRSPEDGILNIFDVKGQLIYEKLPLNEGINELHIKLNPQVYFFRINFNTDKTITKKVVIR